MHSPISPQPQSKLAIHNLSTSNPKALYLLRVTYHLNFLHMKLKSISSYYILLRFSIAWVPDFTLKLAVFQNLRDVHSSSVSCCPD